MGVHDVLGQRLNEDMIMGGRKSDGSMELEALQSIAISLDKIATKLENVEELLININRSLRLR